MRHKFPDQINIAVDVDLPTQDLEDLLDKVADTALVVIGALTVSHILKKLF